MINNLKSMLQIKRILLLLSKEKDVNSIHKELGISINTIKRYRSIFNDSGLGYQQLLETNDDALRLIVFPQTRSENNPTRLKELEPLLPDYVHRLHKTHATREFLWKEYQSDHQNGYSYTQFCEHISRYQLQNSAVMHLVHKPADVLQVDFAGDKLSYIDRQSGSKIYCPVLVCTLPYSSFCYVEALHSQSQSMLIGGFNRCLEYLGGVPHNICSDNLKQVVNKADKYEPLFSELVDQFALYYNVSFTATRVAKPRDKALVERHVGIAYGRIYALLEQQIFYSLPELNSELRKLLDQLNDAPMQRKLLTRRECFTGHELPLLLPLPAKPFEMKYQTKAKVSRYYHVILGEDWHNYSVPFQYIGKDVKLLYDSQYVEIYYNMQRIALHKRKYIKNGFTTEPEHKPDNHLAASLIQQYTPEDFLEKALLVGNYTHSVIQKIITNNFFSQQLFKSCLGIIHLGDIYDKQRLEKACQIALTGHVLNYRVIKNILHNKTDMIIEQEPQINLTEIEHDNIRGVEFYNNIF